MADKDEEKTIANEDVLAKYKAAAECVNRKYSRFPRVSILLNMLTMKLFVIQASSRKWLLNVLLVQVFLAFVRMETKSYRVKPVKFTKKRKISGRESHFPCASR